MRHRGIPVSSVVGPGGDDIREAFRTLLKILLFDTSRPRSSGFSLLFMLSRHTRRVS